MALKTKDLTIESGNDAGKTFIISQMPLLRGDRWANRAILALMKSGIDVRGMGLSGVIDDAKDGGFTSMLDIADILNAVLKALGGIDADIAQELLDELLTTVKIKLDNGSSRDIIPPSDNSDGDISDINTLWKIRIEAIMVNLDFLKAGVTRE